MKRWQVVLLVLLSVVVAFGGYVYLQVRSIDVEQLSEDLYVLRGLGGNTAVLRTAAGTVVVDTMTVATSCRTVNYTVIMTDSDPANEEFRACKASDGAWEIN